MKPAIIVSTKDIAGINIKDRLISLYGFKETTETFHGNAVHMKDGIKLYTTDNETIYSDGIDEEIEGDLIIFATRHQSASAKKSFTVHAPGNWSKAEAGGRDKTLCTALPAMMKEALKKMANMNTSDEFEVAQECTHHGPAINKPCMFIEIGSSEAEWKRSDAGELIAKTINQIITNPVKRCKSVFLIGGMHYSHAAINIMLKSDLSVGHICPKYMVANLDAALIKQAIEKNGDNFDKVVLDWKGIGPEKQNLVKILDEIGVKYEKYQSASKDGDD